MRAQKQLDVRGVQVLFPYDPYTVQLDLIDRLLLALQTRSNALLESPTGTGKTLCILTALLAWREHYIARNQVTQALADEKSVAGSSEYKKEKGRKVLEELDRAVGPTHESDPPDPPRIYYASRTHTQLTNAVRELKNTGYTPRTAVLASREQLCLDPDVSRCGSNSAKATVCRQKVSKKECKYHAGLDNVVRNGVLIPDVAEEEKKAAEDDALTHGIAQSLETNPSAQAPPLPTSAATSTIMDVEDLVTLGTTRTACPYYVSRALLPKSDITFLPYQYLLDPFSRKSQGVHLRGAVVVFDEAHNLEGVCGDSTSFEIEARDLVMCVDEARKCAMMAREVGYQGEFGAEDFEALELLMSKFHSSLLAVPIPASATEVVHPGTFIFELFRTVKVTFDTAEILQKVLEAASSLVVQSSRTSRSTPRSHLSTFLTAIKTCFKPEMRSMGPHELAMAMVAFKVHIGRGTGQGKPRRPVGNGVDDRVLSLWCFSSGVAMKELMACGVRNVILASGTLSPLESFAFEMGIPFPVRLENPHVIADTQAFVSILTKGPAGAQLNCSYQKRDDVGYRMDLGNAVVNFCRVVPDGILCFFPSYGLMEGCLQSWRQSSPSQKSILDRIQSSKHVVVEPQNKQDFARAIETFYALVESPSAGAASQESGVQSGGGPSGAILFAVCRGKVSEGVDFSDSKARAVIVTGLPFPAAKDPKIALKKQYLDEIHSRNRSALDGNTWYRQQASRAVNQAIGRVIRHRNDYGAILLCDDRFAAQTSRDSLPVWVRPYVAVHQSFASVHGTLVKFFRGHEAKNKSSQSAAAPMRTSTSTSSSVSVVNRIATARHLSASTVSTAINLSTTLRHSNHQTTYDRALRQLADSQTTGRSSTALSSESSVANSEISGASTKGTRRAPTVQDATSQPSATDSIKPVEAVKENQRSLQTTSASASDSKPTAARSYLDAVKRLLTKADYRKYQDLLKQYKAKELAILQLVDELEGVFAQSMYDPSVAAAVFDGFVDFVPKKFSDTFKQRMVDFRARHVAA